MKTLLALMIAFAPALSLAHPGHGEHLNQFPLESVSTLSTEAILLGLFVAATLVLVIKKYKSKQ